jgi:hypothetical protein
MGRQSELTPNRMDRAGMPVVLSCTVKVWMRLASTICASMTSSVVSCSCAGIGRTGSSSASNRVKYSAWAVADAFEALLGGDVVLDRRVGGGEHRVRHREPLVLVTGGGLGHRRLQLHHVLQVEQGQRVVPVGAGMSTSWTCTPAARSASAASRTVRATSGSTGPIPQSVNQPTRSWSGVARLPASKSAGVTASRPGRPAAHDRATQLKVTDGAGA